MRKRWLRSEHSEILTSLLQDRKISILHDWEILPCAAGAAKLTDALNMGTDPTVHFNWLVAIRDFFVEYFEVVGHQDGLESVVTLTLCAALERPDITAEMLDHLYPPEADEVTSVSNRNRVSEAAFTSSKREVIIWAMHRNFTPTSQQLQGFLGL
jgi:hypothetical protein